MTKHDEGYDLAEKLIAKHGDDWAFYDGLLSRLAHKVLIPNWFNPGNFESLKEFEAVHQHCMDEGDWIADEVSELVWQIRQEVARQV